MSEKKPACTKVIRIDKEVYLALQKLARPGDTPNQVIRRALGLDK